jgi:ferritin
MLSKKMQAALNQQINNELYASYLYLSMSAWCEAADLPGFAGALRKQAQEEAGHAMKVFDYVNDQDGRVTLDAVPKPPANFKNIVDVYEQALAHEQRVSEQIHKLADLAGKERDYASQALLQWFSTEQVEEEKSARRILEQAKMIGASSSALFFLDRHVEKGIGE